MPVWESNVQPRSLPWEALQTITLTAIMQCGKLPPPPGSALLVDKIPAPFRCHCSWLRVLQQNSGMIETGLQSNSTPVKTICLNLVCSPVTPVWRGLPCDLGISSLFRFNNLDPSSIYNASCPCLGAFHIHLVEFCNYDSQPSVSLQRGEQTRALVFEGERILSCALCLA